MTPRTGVPTTSVPPRDRPAADPREADAYRRATRFLRRYGLLPLTAPLGLPSLVRLVAGERIRGSWWAHPAGHLIYAIAERLDDVPSRYVSLKLVDHRVTWVHRALWPELVAIGTAREPWQMDKLSISARAFLRALDRRGSIRGDELDPDLQLNGYPELREHARALEARMLALVGSVHTSTGAHALTLRSWRGWASQGEIRRFRGTPVEAWRALESRGAQLAHGTAIRWPWDPDRGGARR